MALEKTGQSFKTMAITINGTGTLTGVSVGGLPDGIVDTDMLAANAVTAAKSSGSAKGITMADQWRLSTDRNLSATTETLDANWERVDNSSWGQIGTGMTESSGIFTFPSTGIYLVTFNATLYSISQTQRYAGVLIDTTTDNSNYIPVATSYFSGGVSSGSGVYLCGEAKFLFDVTDTTQRKARFRIQTEYASAAYVDGGSNESLTVATFIRLGDT